jgi:NADH-quinone oxidoreductase subunit J
VIYTQYVYLFQAAGLILLVAMIGAIVLTLRVRQGVRRQKISTQIARRAEQTVVLKKVEPRQGV